jgi:aspartyl/glutamyl-tRNA(Asn/Gln) amidotransferase, C subunit
MNIKDYEAMAKLNLPDDERQLITNLADTLIKSFEALSSIDTADVEPMYTVLDVRNILREDVNVKIVSREELLSNAPAQYEGYFQVPKTLV